MDSLSLISRKNIDGMDRIPRLKLINSLSGFKSANLIGTVDPNKNENLAVFSSAIHLGSNPPLLGCITRPNTVPRHTYENIKDMRWYTVNHIHSGIYEQAHQTSGNYRQDISEFKISGLNSWYSDQCRAPYVKEARIRMGLTLVEKHHIKTNGTVLLVGTIEEVWLPKSCIEEDGFLNIEKAETVAISGLDGYHKTSRLQKMDYVRVDEEKRR